MFKVLLITLFAFNAYALEDYSGKKYEIVTIDERDVNAECAKQDCLAKTVKIEHGDTLDGEDPVAVTCIEKLKGSLLQLHDGEYNERGFCVLSDGSMLGFGSIRAELIQ